MALYLIVATGGAGGDLQPLVAAALAVRDRGHSISFLGDASVASALAALGVDVEVLPPELDLGPRLIGAIREAMTMTAGDDDAAGPIVEKRLAQWAEETAAAIAPQMARLGPDVVVTSLFGVEAVQVAAPACPWAVVNSTFYIGPDPPRPIEEDIAPRAVPLVRRYASLLVAADMVLHATDQAFDFSFDRLPSGHHYVGPLGLWEPPSAAPRYLDEPGDPWVLVSISSQQQDDLPIADAALRALADAPVRVLLTVGAGHASGDLTSPPANAHVERVVPHSEVLRRSVLLVSHAGHGSVMKALWEGRPMVLIPWGRDQPGVAARARALGVAEVVQRDDVTNAAIAAAVDRVLHSDPMNQAARYAAARLQPTDPPGAAAALLASLLD